MGVSINLNVRGLKPSATLAINERSNALRRQGSKIYKLGLGQSPFPVPPSVVDSLRVHAAEKDYLPVCGLEELQAEVAQFHHRKDGVSIAPEDVLVGPGSKELMFLAQLVFYGDIVVPAPCWVSYVPQAQIIGRGVRILPTRYEDRYRVTAEQIHELCKDDSDKPRLMVLNYPGNPDGLSYTSEQLQDIAEAARKHQVIMLSDEIYGELHHKGEHVSIARYYPEGTIISGGLSKWCGAGGWRLGTFAFPEKLRWLRDAMSAVASETYTSVSAPIQYAAITAFRGGLTMERYLSHARRILQALGLECAHRLQKVGVRVHDPEGAFYLFADFSQFADGFKAKGINSGAAMAEKLLADTGVAILPGEDFQVGPEHFAARLAYVAFDGARALAASEMIAPEKWDPTEFAQKWCSNVLDGIDAICDWTKQFT